MSNKITKSTPSFDPQEPHWDQQFTFADGRYFEIGIRKLPGRYNIKLTHVIFSHLPRYLVSISGRALALKAKYPDFLSIRIGANLAKLVPLDLETTKYITIQQDCKVEVKKEVADYFDFMKRFPDSTKDLIDADWSILDGVFSSTNKNSNEEIQ